MWKFSVNNFLVDAFSASTLLFTQMKQIFDDIFLCVLLRFHIMFPLFRWFHSLYVYLFYYLQSLLSTGKLFLLSFNGVGRPYYFSFLVKISIHFSKRYPHTHTHAHTVSCWSRSSQGISVIPSSRPLSQDHAFKNGFSDRFVFHAIKWKYLIAFSFIIVNKKIGGIHFPSLSRTDLLEFYTFSAVVFEPSFSVCSPSITRKTLSNFLICVLFFNGLLFCNAYNVTSSAILTSPPFIFAPAQCLIFRRLIFLSPN